MPARIKLLVSSLEPDVQFIEQCETLIVSAHGCAMRASQPLRTGLAVQFRLNGASETTAHIVNCTRLTPDQQQWMVGAKLDSPGNFWGLNPCPKDWLEPSLADSDVRALQPPSAAASGLPMQQAASRLTPAGARPDTQKPEGKMSTWPLTSPPQRRATAAVTDAVRQLSARADEMEGQGKQNREAIAQFGEQLANSLKELDRLRSEIQEVRPVSQTQDHKEVVAVFLELIQPLKEEIGNLRHELEKQKRVERPPAISPADLVPELEAQVCIPLRKQVEAALATHADVLQGQIAGMQQQLEQFQAMRNDMASSVQSFSEKFERTHAAVPAMIVHQTAPLREQMIELASRIGSLEMAGANLAEQVAGTAEIVGDRARQQHDSVGATHEQLQALTRKQEQYFADAREQLLAIAAQKQDEFLASAKQQLMTLVEGTHEKQQADMAALREQLMSMLRERGDQYSSAAREQLLAIAAQKQD
ncbi:MAG: hypothetical protein JO187_11060, partial [Acidobacteria bacterium]|nr:hypothetical protein [Acidobacteriota bacterium]